VAEEVADLAEEDLGVAEGQAMAEEDLGVAEGQAMAEEDLGVAEGQAMAEAGDSGEAGPEEATGSEAAD
jgi:uncharacterized protein YjiS (DUF1127 family)